MRGILFFVALVVATQSWAQDSPTHSQVRLPGETYEQALERYYDRFEREYGNAPSRGSASDSAVPLTKLDLSSITEWQSLEAIQEAFRRMRDERFLKTKKMPDFARRISWLYPDDGCYTRAALGNQLLDRFGYGRLKRLFVFGRLTAQTPNAPKGKVYWWYHTVPAVRHASATYVLDPAIEPKRPLTYEEWIPLLGNKTPEYKASVCDTYTYVPSSLCMNPTDAREKKEALPDQMGFLDDEWKQLENMNRDPLRELGEDPPWKTETAG